MIIPRVEPGTDLAKQILTFAERLQDEDASPYAISPALLKLDPDRDAAGELRSGIASQDRTAFRAALAGILSWIENEHSGIELPRLPDDLLGELGTLVATRHQPHLDVAMEVVSHIVGMSSRELTKNFLRAVKRSLEYLFTELAYSSRENLASRIPYNEVPRMRELAVKIAVGLQHRGESDEIIGRWIDAARCDPLPEIRRLVSGISQGEKTVEIVDGEEDQDAGPENEESTD